MMPDKYELAIQAARTAIEGQLNSWGFSQAISKAYWDHLYGNGFVTIRMRAEVDKSKGESSELRKILNQDIDVGFMTPEIAHCMSVLYENGRTGKVDDPAMKKKFADAIAKNSFESANALEDALLIALARTGARAALDTLKEMATTQTRAMP